MRELLEELDLPDCQLDERQRYKTSTHSAEAFLRLVLARHPYHLVSSYALPLRPVGLSRGYSFMSRGEERVEMVH